MNVRALAAQVLQQVYGGQSLSTVLLSANHKINPADQAFLQALCFGVCRWFYQLDFLAQQLLDKPLKEKDKDIYFLILIGLLQLTEMRTPEYAAVSETVNATKTLKKIWAKNLVNAVLRNYQRLAESLQKKLLKADARFSHPEWLIKLIKEAWPKQWENILMANNAHPPFSLRINVRKNSRDDYLKKYALDAEIISATASGITLAASNVMDVPGFELGEISVQDGAAQLAAMLLDLQPHQRVLDACAAPGGKTAHILEVATLDPAPARGTSSESEVIAIEREAARLKKITENLQRLNLSAQLICADAADLKAWWDGKLFDRILLDAPCSATGVIRRHPDIKLLRREEDVAKVMLEQARLLEALWTILQPGGILLYATCSILPQENFLMLESFLAKHPDAIEEKIPANWGEACSVGRQILPGMHGMDGFYYGRFRKKE